MLHTFQDMTVDQVEIDPFTKIGSEWALLFAEDGERSNGMTISWGAMGVLWNKNVAMVFVRDSRYTKEIMDASDFFSLNFFGGKEKSGLKYFGMVSGRDEDKMKACGFNINHHKDIGFVDEANFVLVCKKMSATKIDPEDIFDTNVVGNFYADGGYHTMYVGEIVEFLVR